MSHGIYSWAWVSQAISAWLLWRSSEEGEEEEEEHHLNSLEFTWKKGGTQMEWIYSISVLLLLAFPLLRKQPAGRKRIQVLLRHHPLSPGFSDGLPVASIYISRKKHAMTSLALKESQDRSVNFQGLHSAY